MSYVFVDEFDDQNLVPRFDEIDVLRSTEVVGYSLVNRVLAKPKDEEKHGGAREILSFELTQVYSLDDESPLQRSRDGMMTSQRSPITSRFRFNPSLNLSIDSQLSYNTLFSDFDSASFSGLLNFGELYQNNVGLTWYTRRDVELGETRTQQVRAYTGIDLVPERLRWESQVNYNIVTDLLQQQRHFLIYTGNCYGLRLEFTDFQSTNRRDTDIRFAVSLKNVGTFLDLTSGESEGFR